MDTEKQKLLIEYLVSSPDTFAICQNIVKAEYFNPEFRNAIRFIKTYYETYSSTPSIDQIKAESKQGFTVKKVTPDQVLYCTKEIEKFCRRQALVAAVMSSPKLIEDGMFDELQDKIKQAILISLNTNLGTRYFDNPLERLTEMLHNDPTESTGWKEVDELLFGGIGRGEMILFSGNSGAGKSVTLTNLGLNMAKQGKNVLYISLELSEKVISQRIDTMITGIGRKDWRGHVSEIASRVETFGKKTGIIDIKQLPTQTTPNGIRAYLKEYYLHYNMMPDLLIVDYLDKMSPNEHVSADNVFEKDKRCSEQLRQIGVDHNMFIATASQLNRSAVKANEHDHSHIAGGISKINETDIYISLKATEAMRAQNEILFIFEKTRNSDGVGKKVYLRWDQKTLVISDKTDQKSALNFVKREKPIADKKMISNTPSGDGLMDLFSDD